MSDDRPKWAVGEPEKVYHVASAMFEYAQQHESPFLQNSWLGYARAAISAMREPTEAMLNGNSYADWQRMIDVALTKEA